jgi:thiol-disulfide isomerase/thioredoxin
VLIDFWASWCGPCRRELPEIERLYREFKSQGLVVLGINNEDRETASEFFTNSGYTFPVLMDATGDVGKAYRVEAIPTVLILGRDGRIAAHYVGVQSDSTLRSALADAGIE